MSFEFKDLAAQIKSSQPITARDTLALRQWAWASDGVITQHEAERLFELNSFGKSNAREWVDMFVEAISEFVVNQQQPKGYISEANATWLMAQIDRDGRLETLAELEVLVKVFERATNAPDALKTYALRQIENTVLQGDGATRSGTKLRPGVIDEAEVVLLRRLLYASGGSGPGCVSVEEAELLFRLKDATLGADNAPGWQQLFVQCVGNHLMAHSTYRQMDRDQAIQSEAFMNDTNVRLGGFLARSLRLPSWRATMDAIFGPDEETKIAAREAAEARSAQVTPLESAWLKGKFDADGQLDPLEEALLAFVKAEST